MVLKYYTTSSIIKIGKNGSDTKRGGVQNDRIKTRVSIRKFRITY